MTRSCVVLIALVLSSGCRTQPRNDEAVYAYYAYDFPTAREAVRGSAAKNDDQTVLNNLRLGLAALADGDPDEAEDALHAAYELLSTAGLNRDRTTAAVVFHDGVRIWKGEPFEQALAYHAIASLYATKGDWENVRAASANSLFRLTDFGRDQDAESVARKAVHDDDYLDSGYTAADTNFALGLVMQALATDCAGGGDAESLYDIALEIDPALGPLIDTLRARNFDTLLIVDYGKGPTKIAYGPDGALSRFDPQEPDLAPISVAAGSAPDVTFGPVCDVNVMGEDLRWNNLEGIRQAKSALGEGLLIGGSIVAATSSKDENVLIGLGMMVLGAISKSNALADTRYLEFAPQSVYLVPLELGEARDLTVRVGAREPLILDDVAPGTQRAPRAIYLRLHGFDTIPPHWLGSSSPTYGNDVTGVRTDDFPWILGGRDVSTPSRDVLDAYQRGGSLHGYTLSDLVALYESEGIVIGRTGHHVLEGGNGLFTPTADSIGYKRLVFDAHPNYQPRSELVREAARAQRDGTRETTP